MGGRPLGKRRNEDVREKYCLGKRRGEVLLRGGGEAKGGGIRE